MKKRINQENTPKKINSNEYELISREDAIKEILKIAKELKSQSK